MRRTLENIWQERGERVSIYESRASEIIKVIDYLYQMKDHLEMRLENIDDTGCEEFHNVGAELFEIEQQLKSINQHFDQLELTTVFYMKKKV